MRWKRNKNPCGAMDGTAHDAAGCLDGTDCVAMEADQHSQGSRVQSGEPEQARLKHQKASGGHTGGTKCPAAVADE